MTLRKLEPVPRIASPEEFQTLAAWIDERTAYGGGLADVTYERPKGTSSSARYLLHLFGDEVWELIAPSGDQPGRFVPVAHYFDWHDPD